MDTRFAPYPGRFGTMLQVAQAANVGNVTANDTTRFFLPVAAGKYWVSKLSVVCDTVGADADGSIVATFYKYSGVSDAGTALNTATNLETLVTKETRDVPVTATLTDVQRLLDTSNGDSLYVEVVNDSAAIDTQPTKLSFAVELFALK